MGRGAEKSTPANRRFLILLLVCAAVSGAVKDLGRFQELTSGLSAWAISGLKAGSTVYASAVSPVEPVGAESLARPQRLAEQFRSGGPVAPGPSIEIKDINGSIEAEPNVGGEIEVVATKKARRADTPSVHIKVVRHASGNTSCAAYSSESSSPADTSEPGRRSGDSSGSTGVRNYDVSVNVSGDIKAKLGNAYWSGSLPFKTVNGSIALDLPTAVSTKIDACTSNGEIDSDFPLNLLGRVSKKHVCGKIGGAGRELILKTLNGRIHLRRAG